MKKNGFRDFEFSMFTRSDFPAYVRSAGHFKLYEIDSPSCKKADFCELFWCMDGKGCFELEGQHFLVHPGDVWYYPKGSQHSFCPAGNFFHYRWFTIAGRRASVLFEITGIPPGLSFGGNCPEELFGKLELLIRQSTRAKRLEQMSVGFEILCRAASGIRQKRPVNDYLLEARNIIDHDFANPELNIQRLADILHVNRVQLSRGFPRQFGVSISTYLRNLRLQKGMELLRRTNLSIEDIAKAAGYGSANYFGKVIIAATGQNPSCHRNELPGLRKSQRKDPS